MIHLSRERLSCLLLLLTILSAAANLNGETVLEESFETRNPFKFWTTNGTYTVNFEGLTQERKSSGKKSYKLDVTLGTAGYAYWSIPFRYPGKNPILLSGMLYRDAKTSKSIQVGLGANVIFPPTQQSGCSPLGQAKEADRWTPIRGDVISPYLEASYNIFDSQQWGVNVSEVGIGLDRVGLFIVGSPGDRAVVYVDDLTLETQPTSVKDYEREIRKRWSGVPARFKKQLDSWQLAGRKLDLLLARAEPRKDLSPGLSRLKEAIREKQTAVQRQIDTIRARQSILFSEFQDIESFYKFSLTNLSALLDGLVADGPVLVYVVPPISHSRILPRDPMVPGRLTREINLSAAPGEFEAASFVLSPIQDVDHVTFQVSELKDGRKVIPAQNIDLRFVKCWYQAGSAWTGIGQDKNRRVLVPELLLKDPSLVKVDYAAEKNYVKIKTPSGENYVWTSNPKEPSKDYRKIVSINEFPVRDADALQPIDLKAGMNQQVWITVHVPKSTPPGDYAGRMTLRTNTRELQSQVLTVTVLPFTLAPPKTCYDLQRDFISSIYYRGAYSPKYPQGSISSDYKSWRQLEAELRDMHDHGITNPLCYQNLACLPRYLAIRQKIGILPQPFYILQGDAEGVGAESAPEILKATQTLVKSFGFTETYFYGRDEAVGEALVAQRKVFESVHRLGGRVFAAGQHNECFPKMGDCMDLLVNAYYPRVDYAEKWHAKGNRIWMYAYPQGGPEDPALWRRNFGLLVWKANYDGAGTYAYQDSFNNVWNDFDHFQYRDHNLTYPTVDGVIDTIAIEGYREGIDDIRYATTLKMEIVRASRSGKNAVKETARSAANYLQSLSVDNGADLDTIRATLIRYIRQLLDGMAGELT